MAAFGWSVGDIVASIQLVAKIVVALKETGGAKSEYQESIEFLFGLEITLQNLQTIAPVLLTRSQESILQVEIEKIANPISIFFERVKKLDTALGSDSKKGSWRAAPKKVQWAMQVSKEAKVLRDRISVPIASLNILLQSQVLCAMSELHKKLPSVVSDKLASCIDNSVTMSSGLRDEILSLKESVKNYEQAQSTLKQDIITAFGDAVSRENKPLLAGRERLDRLTEDLDRRLESGGSGGDTQNTQNSQTSSRIEQLVVEKSHDLNVFCGSLNTIAECHNDHRSERSGEVPLTSRAAFIELKNTFCKCIRLLALGIQQLFKEVMIYLGPQFLLFLLTFKQLGNHMPKLLLGDRFLFEDVLGRRKYLPIEFFQHYSVFSSFLQESFDGLPGQQYVSRRQYQLTDANSNIINSKIWHRSVARKPKVTMSIILEPVVDDLFDNLACPRCSTSETFAKPNMSIQCSSCNLHYKTANLKINTTDKAGHDALSTSEAPAEQPGGIQLDESNSDSVEDNNNAEDSPEWAEATVVVTGSNTGKPLTLILQAGQQGLWDLPWNEDDLRHFKRVLIPDVELAKLSNASALERLSMAYARLVANSRNALKDRLSVKDNGMLEKLLESGETIFAISKHPSISLLPSDTDFEPDWRTLLYFRGLTDLNALTEQSKRLFKDTMILYHELRNYGHLKPVEQRTKRYVMATNISHLIHNSRALKTWLDQLFDIDNAWRHGGLLTTNTITQKVQPDPEEPEEAHDVATCLEVTDHHIILALDTGLISIFNHNGQHLRSLHGHTGGVWAIAIYGEILVSGSVDREVRVWDIVTGDSIHALSGHTSTVRCLTFVNEDTAVSGSRDSTLRVWNIRNGLCTAVLSGHNHSIRCVTVTGDLIVSGSYDKTARIWNVFDGHCIWTLRGHSERIYCVAADSKRVVTGSMDTSVRVWDIRTGTCLAVLQGHTSLVGQLQLCGDTVVTGSSDCSIRVWSLLKMAPIQRIAAAEKAVTSLQVDHRRIISGSIDGTVRVWDRSTGELIRELGARSDRVWRVYMSESMAIIVRSSTNKLMLEVWSFSHKDKLRSGSAYEDSAHEDYDYGLT